MRQWVRASVPAVKVRRDLLGEISELEEEGSECSFALGAGLNRSGSPVLVELRHGEVFVFPSDDEAPLSLDSPHGLWIRSSGVEAGDPPEEWVEVVDFQIDETDRFDPDGAVTGECRFRFLPGADPLDSIVFASQFGQGSSESFSGPGSAPGPFPGDAGIGPAGIGPSPGGEASGPGFSAHAAPWESIGTGPDYCFALDFDIVHRRDGWVATTRVTRYTYLSLRRDMTSARFEFAASSHETGWDEEFVPRATPVYLRLCAAPPPACNLSPAPLSRAAAKLVTFRRESP